MPRKDPTARANRPRKRNKRSQSQRKVWKKKKEAAAKLQHVSDDFVANNLLEEFPKPEPFPETDEVPECLVIPVFPQITNDPKPEIPPRKKPAVSVQRKRVPKVDRSAFCELCLRKWPPGQAVRFSSRPSWGSLDPVDGKRKVVRCLGIEVELDGRSICASCWKMVEMWVDFRESCLKARGWMDRYDCGLLGEVEGKDNWISEETVESLDITHLMVRNHIDRINGAKEGATSNQLVEDVVEDLELAFEVGEVKLELDEPQEEVELFNKEAAMDETTYDNVEPAEEPTDSVITEPIQIQVFTCAQCSMKFDRRHSYSIHVNRCKDKTLNPNLFSCHICGVSFKENFNLKFHMNRHRGIKPYSCRVKCDASFYSYHVRRNHELRCGADPLVCITCGALKKTKEELETHMRVHAEPTVPCETCGKLFRTMRAQRKHQSAHSDERKFRCKVCGKGFKSSTALNVHQRIHTQEKPYPCQICGQGFAYKCLVKPHVMKCHAGGLD
ncbi:zinc finger and BTB domain-containing protein 49-like [Culex pipiens pallens]|uniref:zinc finger and BTB domain-containing protein 49-like n=1 Tax=Culex pipiens pallens TaxID=42434 RepID=UPI0022AAEF5A|nr:zinc finger and BTB domain-containing protein 49-like [Culex pipiens pallens]